MGLHHIYINFIDFLKYFFYFVQLLYLHSSIVGILKYSQNF